MQISFAALSCSNLAALSCSNLAALSCSNLAAHCLLQPCGLCVFRMQISLICYICNLYLYHILPFCNLPIYLYPQLRTVILLPPPRSHRGRTGAVVRASDFEPKGFLVRAPAGAPFVVALSKSHLPLA